MYKVMHTARAFSNTGPRLLSIVNYWPRCSQQHFRNVSSTSQSTKSRAVPDLKICIVGSGPAGFYSAYRLLTNIPTSKIDIFEALPVPYGLARYGVAPDHPEVKNVTHKFNEVASSGRVKYYGNIRVGVDIKLKDLRQAYDCILFAHGASMNRTLGIQGEELDGVLSARSFVGWYNGLPETAHLDPPLDSTETAVIVGQGNVALDIARVLLSPVDELRKTDMADYALEQLSRSKIKQVKIVGRRGPLQASFTIKEIRELINVPSLQFLNTSQEQYRSILATSTLPRPQKRLMELLAKQDTTFSEAGKSWDLQYALSPKSFLGSAKLEAIEFEKNDLQQIGGQVKAIGMKEFVRQEAQMAFLSIGYQSQAIPGMEDIGVIFDTNRHIIPNDNGRVVSLDGPVPSIYCSGWAKVGPVGVIASTMRDAFETADALTKDWLDGKFQEQRALLPEDLIAGLSAHHRVVTWQDWKKIEETEFRLGSKDIPVRPMRKLTDIDGMLVAASRSEGELGQQVYSARR